MRPGKLVGTGRTAEVFEFGSGRVIKLLRPGFDESGLRLEAKKSHAAASADAPAPGFHGFEVIEGRLGAIFDQISGPSMLDVLMSRPWLLFDSARTMGELHCRILETESSDLVDVKERLASKIAQAAHLDSELKKRSTDALVALGDGAHVLHGDFHPGNILMSHPEPRVIDWIDAARGHPAADIARTMWLISPYALPVPGGPRRAALGVLARLVRAGYSKRVLQCSRVTKYEVREWALPVLAGRLSEGIDHEEPYLIEAVRWLAG